MQPYVPFDGSWPVVLMFGIMGTFTFGLTNTGHEMCHEMLSWANEALGHGGTVRPVRPEVLVITGNREDQNRVALAVNPRGYRVVVAETAARGRESLNSDASRIAVIVVDMKIPGADHLAAMAHSLAPMAKVIRLRPSHTAVDVTKPLVDGV